jgi:hypothetical protein
VASGFVISNRPFIFIVLVGSFDIFHALPAFGSQVGQVNRRVLETVNWRGAVVIRFECSAARQENEFPKA